MKIFSASQVRQWDAYTIAHGGASADELMEKAATACYHWIIGHATAGMHFIFFCGMGNNGGDGLAIARMLINANKKVSVYILEAEKRSAGFLLNLERIETLLPGIAYVDNYDFPVLPDTGAIIIEALYGTGLNRPLKSIAAHLVQYINQSGKPVISIDMPSGLFADINSEGNTIIHATHTLSFQTSKLAFLMTENRRYTGMAHILDISLHQHFYEVTPTLFYTIDADTINMLYKPRDQAGHKYNFGHVLLYTGSKNMMGAAILSATAVLRSGAGLVTVFTQEGTQAVIQTALPEAIASTEENVAIASQKKSAIGIGPGLEINDANLHLLHTLISSYHGGLVIDASALHLLSTNTSVLKERSGMPVILTPHTGEFEKMFGKATHDFERMEMVLQHATALNCFIVLKGPHTMIACPDGTAFFNTTGNAGMATAGSGDVLTGIITGLLAQGYTQKDACILGVYIHGMAGDIAAENKSQESMMAGDIINCLGEAYKKIAAKNAAGIRH